MSFKANSINVKSIIEIDGVIINFEDLRDENKKKVSTQLNKQGMESMGYKENNE
jgi:hypothetical protein